jgi:type II secretory pathway pseudopilin PulG
MVGCAILVLWAAISIPSMVTAPTRAKYSRAEGDTKFAVRQAIQYAKDKGVYPTSLRVLAEEGYMAAIPDKDPWGNDWVLSPLLTQGRTPRKGDNVYVFSKGQKWTGVYPEPFTYDTGEDGSVGYSSVDGCFGPERYVCYSKHSGVQNGGTT